MAVERLHIVEMAEVHGVSFNVCAIRYFSAKEEFGGSGSWRTEKHRRVMIEVLNL